MQKRGNSSHTIAGVTVPNGTIITKRYQALPTGKSNSEKCSKRITLIRLPSFPTTYYLHQANASGVQARKLSTVV